MFFWLIFEVRHPLQIDPRFKLYSCPKSLFSLYDCIMVGLKKCNQSNLTNWDKGPLMAIRFFRTATQPCIKWWREQACNLINALKTAKMDNEGVKSQMAQLLCLLGTLTAYWSARESLEQGQRCGDAWLGYCERDRCRTAVTGIY